MRCLTQLCAAQGSWGGGYVAPMAHVTQVPPVALPDTDNQAPLPSTQRLVTDSRPTTWNFETLPSTEPFEHDLLTLPSTDTPPDRFVHVPATGGATLPDVDILPASQSLANISTMWESILQSSDNALPSLELQVPATVGTGRNKGKWRCLAPQRLQTDDLDLQGSATGDANTDDLDLQVPATGGTKHHLRMNAKADRAEVARQYGDDLMEVPPDWLCIEHAHKTLAAVRLDQWTERGWIPLDLTRQVDVLEVYSGVAHFTECAVNEGLTAAPPIDLLPTISRTPWPCAISIDLLDSRVRQIVWALVAILRPYYVHIGFPCTFWSAFSYLCCKRSADELERRRLESLAHVFCAVQLCELQHQQRRFCSFEQPPACKSWSLDIIQ